MICIWLLLLFMYIGGFFDSLKLISTMNYIINFVKEQINKILEKLSFKLNLNDF